MIDGVLNRDVLSFEIEKSCIDDKKVIGSFQKNSATIELLNPDNKYSNLKGTYINTYKGTFYVDNIEPIQEKIKIKLSCYDLAQKFEKPYDSNKFTFPLTLKEWRNAICTEVGVEYDNTDFPNSDYELNSEPYIKKDATYKDVIKLIAQASSCWAIIDYDDKLYFNWFNNTLIEVQDWFDLTTEDEPTDPVNIVVLGRGVVEDNVIYPETEPANPKEIRIDSNDILDLNRKKMIVPIYNQVKNFKYTVFSMKTIGFLNAKIGNKVKYPDLYSNKKESYIMHHTLTFLGGDYSDSRNYTSQFEAVELDETNTNYKYAESIEERIDKTEITTNKLDGEIKAITQRTTQISDDLNNNYYTKTNINELVQTSETGITNTFSEAGGNNIFRNTGLFAKESKPIRIKANGNNIEIENSIIGETASIKLAGKSTQVVSTDPISPSPDYTSEIESINGNVEIKSTGINQWNNDLVNTKNVTKNTDGFTMNNIWATSVLENKDILKTFKPNTKYTIKIISKILAKPTTLGTTGTSGYDLVLYRANNSVWLPLNNYEKYTANVGDIFTSYKTITTPADLTDLRVLGYSFYGNNDGSTNYKGAGSVEIQQIMVIEGTYTKSNFPNYEPYQSSSTIVDLKGNELTKYDKLIIKDGKATVQKKSRHLSLAIKDMNNSEDYPGWQNQTQLKEDYPDLNNSFNGANISMISNVTEDSTNIGLNTASSTNVLMLFSKLFNRLTQTEIKAKYPDLVFDLIYELKEPYEIDLGSVDTLNTFEGTTYISNSEDADMEVEYECDITYEFWNGYVIKGTNDNSTSKSSMLLLNGSLSQEQEVPNGNYSISFYYQKLIELANASVVINENEYQLDSTEVKQFYTGEQDSETKEYIVQPITVTNGHIKIEFKCDTNNGVEVYDLMCNKGSVKLAYSQNQNETTTDTVNISKGITITSSVDENVKFKANYDGIRVLDGNNTVKTKFTDKGMETNEAKITEKAEVTGSLFQEVDDQTWITKM